jgi:hypothetical protein
MSQTMKVEEALALFMERGEAWGCRIVARANPRQAFEPLGGKIPALWLQREGGFESYGSELFAALKPREREQAAKACARQLTVEAAAPIGPALGYGSNWPAASEKMLDSARQGLERALASLFEAAGAAEDSDVEKLSRAAKEGLEQGLCDCAQSTPALASAIRALGWEALAWAALAGAERSAFGLCAGRALPGRRLAL